MADENGWTRLLREKPDHSVWYVDRFRRLAADGEDLAGEARLVDAMVPRRSRILDAGCGPGRVGAALAAAGHDVVGVDLDPVLIEAARQDHPGPQWLVGDLAELDLPGPGFDAVVSAGNVMAFAAPDTRVEILRRMRSHLRDDGPAGLRPDLLLSTWDLRPLADDSDFLVAVLSFIRPIAGAQATRLQQ